MTPNVITWTRCYSWSTTHRPTKLANTHTCFPYILYAWYCTTFWCMLRISYRTGVHSVFLRIQPRSQIKPGSSYPSKLTDSIEINSLDFTPLSIWTRVIMNHEINKSRIYGIWNKSTTHLFWRVEKHIISMHVIVPDNKKLWLIIICHYLDQHNIHASWYQSLSQYIRDVHEYCIYHHTHYVHIHLSPDITRELTVIVTTDALGRFLNRIITALSEGMGDVGSARYERALLPTWPP